MSNSPRRNDLDFLNGDPLQEDRRWNPLSRDAWARIEARLRRNAHIHYDFVTVPFPRLVSLSDRHVAQAVESYKREAAIVDPRLSHEVTCAFKATALSDLCEQLRGDTGVQLTAGPSVADEKVTLFCEKLPLREVMRQLSRPFGYTWLRSRGGGEYRYELVQDLRSQLLEEELRNRDRNAALLALDRRSSVIGLTSICRRTRRWRSPKQAPPAEKSCWRTSPASAGARSRCTSGSRPRIGCSCAPGRAWSSAGRRRADERPLPPDVARGVLQGVTGECAGTVRARRRIDPGELSRMIWGLFP